MEKEKFSLFRSLAYFTIWFLRPLSISMDVLLHREIGERYVGFTAWRSVALFIGVFYWCPVNHRLAFTYLWVVCMIRFGVCSLGRKTIDASCLSHSRHGGRPFFGLFKNRFEEDSLRATEIFLVVLTGICTLYINQPFGVYLITCGIAMSTIPQIQQSIAHDRLLDKIDALLEKESHDREYRKLLPSQGAHCTVVSRSNQLVGAGRNVNFEVAASELPSTRNAALPA